MIELRWAQQDDTGIVKPKLQWRRTDAVDLRDWYWQDVPTVTVPWESEDNKAPSTEIYGLF